MWLYSFLYQASYLVPELIISVVVINYVLKPFLKKKVISGMSTRIMDMSVMEMSQDR